MIARASICRGTVDDLLYPIRGMQQAPRFLVVIAGPAQTG
jgi:hypothetical protein